MYPWKYPVSLLDDLKKIKTDMKKNLLLYILLLSATCGLFAQENKDCKAAQDSVKARFARKELSFYDKSKKMAKMMYYYKIDKNHYERVLVEKMKKDTSVGFMTCYNKAYQAILDSAFGGDFFRISDSILADYDAKGKGYRASDFRGGKDSLDLWLKKNVKLPSGAKPDDSDKLIKVYYFAQIDEKGNVTDVKFAKTNCKICEPVVTEALKKLPPFVPATQAGVATKSTFILPYSNKEK
jgi:hypothetical protein